MKILTVNYGSASIKCALYELHTLPGSFIHPLWEGYAEQKSGTDQTTITVENEQGQIASEVLKKKSPQEILARMIDFLLQEEGNPVSNPEEIDAVAHRIAHGGYHFKESTIIHSSVKEKIADLTDFSPLHTPMELEGIAFCEQIFKDKPQVAVFDTTFHRSMPWAAKIYPGPRIWFESNLIRYGFHGISFQYCSKRCAEMLNEDLCKMKMVICHLGSGASLCAIKEGQSVDTTMGLTPLEGLMMNTRSGTVDPGLLLYLLKKKNIAVEDVISELYEKSGLLGLSGFSEDMREIVKKYEDKDERAITALDVYVHRLNASVGAMMASLQGMDTLVFTGGIGENTPLLREKVCRAFAFTGLKLDQEKNDLPSAEDREISAEGSTVRVQVIRTRENFEMALECWKKMAGK